MGANGPPQFCFIRHKGVKPIKCVSFMTGPPKLLIFRRPCSTQLHTLTETVEAAYGAVVFALCQQYRVSCHKKRHYWNSDLTSCLLNLQPIQVIARARLRRHWHMANTINLANSSFTDVDLDCTVSKESWCLFVSKESSNQPSQDFYSTTSVLGVGECGPHAYMACLNLFIGCMCGLCFRLAGMQYYTYVYAYFNCPPVVKENEQKKSSIGMPFVFSVLWRRSTRARRPLFFYIPQRVRKQVES